MLACRQKKSTPCETRAKITPDVELSDDDETR